MRARLFLIAIILLSLIITINSQVRPAAAVCGTTNVALNKPVLASSTQSGLTAAAAVDGNVGTRWGSDWSDPQTFRIDLGVTTNICRVKLNWEAAYAKAYQIQVSNDAATWTTIFTTTTGDGGIDDIAVTGTGRYVRLNGTVRATQYGYSLWEFEVYADSAAPTNTATAVPPTATRTNTLVPTNTTVSTATRTNTPTNTAVVPTNTPVAGCGTSNVALNKPVTVSSTENVGTPGSAAVDGNTGTRWSSAAADPQWIYVDLGATMNICHVKLNWETAYGKSYQIQTSNDTTTWTPIYTTTTSDGGIDDLTGLSGSGRYVRMFGSVRATQWGYSLWEFEVYNSVTGTTPVPTNTPSRTPTRSNTPSIPTNTSVAPTATAPGGCGTNNFALLRPTTASSVENVGTTANLAVDGNATTRWSSAASDPQWIQLDFGAAATFCHVKLNWEAAYGKSYQIQTSNDAVNWTPIYTTTTGDGGIDDLTGLNGSGRYLRMFGSVRATAYGYSLWEFEAYGSGGVTPTATPTPVPTATPDAAFWGDTSTIPAASNVMMFKFLNRTNGHYPDSQVYWSFNGTVHSIAEQQYFDMPANSSGRMYFYLGSPTSQYNDFIEFTIGPAEFNGNTTRVDAFGVKLAFRLHTKDGYDAAVGEDGATFAEDRSVTFQKFINEVPAEFKHLAQIQAPYRIPAPAHMGETDFLPGGLYANYFDAYLQANGSTATTADVFGCTNTLGADAGLCAAFNRHVRELPQSQWFDTTKYYLTAPANYYAKFWHDHSLDKLSYGFPYDDYANQSSFITHGNPQWLLVAIGW